MVIQFLLDCGPCRVFRTQLDLEPRPLIVDTDSTLHVGVYLGKSGPLPFNSLGVGTY